jgi:hypothetical protein
MDVPRSRCRSWHLSVLDHLSQHFCQPTVTVTRVAALAVQHCCTAACIFSVFELRSYIAAYHMTALGRPAHLFGGSCNPCSQSCLLRLCHTLSNRCTFLCHQTRHITGSMWIGCHTLGELRYIARTDQDEVDCACVPPPPFPPHPVRPRHGCPGSCLSVAVTSMESIRSGLCAPSALSVLR